MELRKKIGIKFHKNKAIVCNIAKRCQLGQAILNAHFPDAKIPKKGGYVMLTVAYVGFGNSVINYHLPYVKTRDYIRVKTIYRREEDRVEQLERDREKRYPSIQFTTDFNMILDDPEIDLVIVNAPNATHYTYAKQILESGKHALIEKPLAMSSQEAKELFAFAKEKNLILMANQNRRYDCDFLALKSVVESGKCGDIVEVESHYDYFRPNIRNFTGYLFGLAVHTIDQMVSLFGIPERVVYDVRSIHHPHEADDYFDLDFFYGDFKVIIKTCYSIKIKYPKFLLHGRKGSYIQYDIMAHNSDKEKGVEPYDADFTPVSEDKFGTLCYIDDNGEEHQEKVPIYYTDYAKLYDGLYSAIKEGKENR